MRGSGTNYSATSTSSLAFATHPADTTPGSWDIRPLSDDAPAVGALR